MTPRPKKSSANEPALLPVVAWHRGAVRLIDQTRLPGPIVFLDCPTPAVLHDAIRRLVVRGAPAIGIAAGYGVLLGLDHPVPDDFLRAGDRRARGALARRAAWSDASATRKVPALLTRVELTAAYLATSRPTAVNLFYALDRMVAVARRVAADTPSPDVFRQTLLDEARAVHDEDLAMSRRLGAFGLPLVTGRPGADGATVGVLTHCNAGRLASSGHGLALAPLYAAHAAGRRIAVYADETRPLCQGARLTTTELLEAKVPVTLICDNMAAQVMREGRIDLVMVGADRIAANGDTANKIGTYGVAVLARYHKIPFYVVAPSSTFDLTLADGGDIPIEQRDGGEIRDFFGRATAPSTVPVYNPAFDVTPASLITALVTDRGVIAKPTRAKIARVFQGSSKR